MVSFQCNGCGDVVTKPKLDKHRAMCSSSFDCIDCSKRFETPADYKDHTSCISEAEKYQKTVYNGGSQKHTGPERNGRNQRSWQQGGGRQWGNNRQKWQQPNVNKATGANDTPLGTPVRMSPVNDTPAIGENSEKKELVAEMPKKRKAETETTDTSEPAKKKKKKQKTVDDAHGTTEPEVAEAKVRTKLKSTSKNTITGVLTDGTDSQPVENGNNLQDVGEKTKKKKKEQKAKETDRDVGVVTMEKKDGEEEGKEKGRKKEGEGKEKKEKKKERRKEKEDPSRSGQPGTIADTEAIATAQPTMTGVPSTNSEEARSTKSKKKSKSKDQKSKLKAATTEETPDVTVSATPRPAASDVAGVARDDQRNGKKKRHSGENHEDNGDAERDALGNNENSKEKRKEKKKKRKSEGQTVNVTE